MDKRREQLWGTLGKAAQARSNQAALALKRAQDSLERLRQRDQSFEQALLDYANRREERRQQEDYFFIGEIENQQRFCKLINEARASLAREIIGAQALVQKAQAALTEQLKNKSSYELLQAEAKAERLKWLNTQEAKTLDEIASQRHQRKKD